jgi:hypothetical protein
MTSMSLSTMSSDVGVLMASPLAQAPKSPDRVFVADTGAHPPDYIPNSLGRRTVGDPVASKAGSGDDEAALTDAEPVAKSPAAG